MVVGERVVGLAVVGKLVGSGVGTVGNGVGTVGNGVGTVGNGVGTVGVAVVGLAVVGVAVVGKLVGVAVVGERVVGFLVGAAVGGVGDCVGRAVSVTQRHTTLLVTLEQVPTDVAVHP